MQTLYTFRAMTLEDLPQVTEIDRLSFSIPWSIKTYEYEIAQNAHSQMVVVTCPTRAAPPPNGREGSGLRRWLSRLAKHPPVPLTDGSVVGMGGCWCAVGEVHISTIAVHPDWRGRHIGEILLSGMIAHGAARGAQEAVLEVRVGNTVAQNLYRKYGFEILSRRPRYYHDDNEDAYVMQVGKLDRAYLARLDRLRRELQRSTPYVDAVNGAP